MVRSYSGPRHAVNSHTILHDGRQGINHQFSNWPYVRGPHTYQLILGFYLLHVKKVLESFNSVSFILGLLTILEECAANSFGSLTCITPYKRVHCTLKFCSRKWRYFILNSFFRVAFSIRITTCIILEDIPLSKEVHYRTHKSTQSVPSHSQTNQGQILTSYIYTIHFIIIQPMSK